MKSPKFRVGTEQMVGGKETSLDDVDPSAQADLPFHIPSGHLQRTYSAPTFQKCLTFVRFLPHPLPFQHLSTTNYTALTSTITNRVFLNFNNFHYLFFTFHFGSVRSEFNLAHHWSVRFVCHLVRWPQMRREKNEETE